MRKDLGEGQEEKNEPQNGEEESPKKPRDPQDRRDGQKDPPEGETGDPQTNNAPIWEVDLPPQIRDAFIRGDFERIPEQYRKLVPMYLKWLQRESRRDK
jgi:hypothetical protein